MRRRRSVRSCSGICTRNGRMLCLSLADTGFPDSPQARRPKAPVAAMLATVADVEMNFRREYERRKSGTTDLPEFMRPKSRSVQKGRFLDGTSTRCRRGQESCAHRGCTAGVPNWAWSRMAPRRSCHATGLLLSVTLTFRPVSMQLERVMPTMHPRTWDLGCRIGAWLRRSRHARYRGSRTGARRWLPAPWRQISRLPGRRRTVDAGMMMLMSMYRKADAA